MFHVQTDINPKWFSSDSIVSTDNFVAEITPYLRKFVNLHQEIKDRVEKKQDQRKEYAGKKRRNAVSYTPGDREWVTTHQKSNKANKKSAKFTPRRDGPYIVTTQRSLTSYEVADPNNPNVPLGTYHSSVLRPCLESHANSQPVHPLRRKGHPKKN
ncbi:hypothetical protein HNY73_003353 [Argiope bruennichi]|uniref:Uncharacterized protein n=1 Tax=Argiope bruennichi TaxID=94029 RepID=A0A8T0FL47_ARGBR|nr:hypothetical protein HNY73_003353 [Argiope bruennichi]